LDTSKSAPNTAALNPAVSTTSYFNNIGNQPAAQLGAAQNNLSAYTGANLTTNSTSIQSAPVLPPNALNPLLTQQQTNPAPMSQLGNSLNAANLGQQPFGAAPNLLLPPKLTAPITSTPTNPQIPNAMFNQPATGANQFSGQLQPSQPPQPQQFNPPALGGQFANQLRQNTPPVGPPGPSSVAPPPTGLGQYRPPGPGLGGQLPPSSLPNGGQYRPSTLPPPPTNSFAAPPPTTNQFQPPPLGANNLNSQYALQSQPPPLQNNYAQQPYQQQQPQSMPPPQAPQMNRPPPTMADIIAQNKHNQPITPPQTTPVGSQPPGQFYQPPVNQGQSQFLQQQQQQQQQQQTQPSYSVNNLKNRALPQAIDLLKEKKIIVPYEHEDEVPRPLFQHGFYTQVNCHQE
jgi:hypothetical protein